MSEQLANGTEDVQEETEVIEADSFPCPACGSQMQFDPTSQTLSCSYCENSVELVSAETPIIEYDFESAGEVASHDWGVGTAIIRCNGCGAEIVIDQHDSASFCPYCGSSQVVQQNEEAGICPESLIPFKVDKDSAKQAFKSWIQGKWMAPGALKKEYKSDKLTGVYVPHWTYDSSTNTYYTCQVGHDYYVTQTYTTTVDGKPVTKTRRVKKTRWSHKSGYHTQAFDDVLVNASGKFQHEKMAQLEPFHFNELVPYKGEYLSGFIAEKYAVSLNKGFEYAQKLMDTSIRQNITKNQHADHVRNLRVNTSFSNITYKHILLPVWLSSYEFKDNIYQYMVNGQTGEVQGDAPTSWVKVTLIIAAILAIAVMIYSAYQS